ncbi:MAG: amidohydrolase family protein, partial [Defluviitaleaceae bacterium]|nr:amidohydrolase family protein [Defluviitaleaceae bacterium]
MERTVITGGRVITTERTMATGGVVIGGGRIESVFEGEYHAQGAERIIDAAGRFISPGFIDLHVHGGGGDDFMCGEADKVAAICRFHMRHGTTSIVPTLSSADQTVFLRAMEGINEALGTMTDGPDVPGLHLEGPYFAMSQKGAQDPRFVRNPDPAEYMEVADRFSNILRWSIAPELPGALEMAAVMKSRGIRMCIGHSDALYDEAV